MIIASKTDTGIQRKNNQDSFAAAEFEGDAALAVVCDGMGGANGGNIASALAVKTVSDSITSNFSIRLSGKSVRNIISSAIYNANLNIYKHSISDSGLKGMGTTIVLALVTGGLAFIAHAGDSRAYLIRDDKILQITRDHSIVQSMVESGKISIDEALFHPNKNVITRALGVDEKIDFDYNEVEFFDDDILLLCTDGLTNYVDPQTIKIVTETTEFSQIPDKLIAIANEAGGGDNITAVVISPKGIAV